MNKKLETLDIYLKGVIDEISENMEDLIKYYNREVYISYDCRNKTYQEDLLTKRELEIFCLLQKFRDEKTKIKDALNILNQTLELPESLESIFGQHRQIKYFKI